MQSSADVVGHVQSQAAVAALAQPEAGVAAPVPPQVSVTSPVSAQVRVAAPVPKQVNEDDPPLTPLWGAQADKSVSQNLVDLTTNAIEAVEKDPTWMKYHAKYSLDSWLINNHNFTQDHDLIKGLLNSLETQIKQEEEGKEVRRETSSGKTPFKECLEFKDAE
jgi:hypothetical protein